MAVRGGVAGRARASGGREAAVSIVVPGGADARAVEAGPGRCKGCVVVVGRLGAGSAWRIAIVVSRSSGRLGVERGRSVTPGACTADGCSTGMGPGAATPGRGSAWTGWDSTSGGWSSTGAVGAGTGAATAGGAGTGFGATGAGGAGEAAGTGLGGGGGASSGRAGRNVSGSR